MQASLPFVPAPAPVWGSLGCCLGLGATPAGDKPIPSRGNFIATGKGNFGMVVAGRWRGSPVAIKQLPLEDERLASAFAAEAAM